ncbi:unnamed protein product [Adineta ricciae]|uniref:F-BAR domain-containing protein n=1 Tax=Adineta ricciae TaxID=249248 RepID=A0A814D5R8_ADIRI|nr:unnamed protein product [Adineta ricciae]
MDKFFEFTYLRLFIHQQRKIFVHSNAQIQVQCIRSQSETTPEKLLSNPWHGKGFCEPGQYESALHRCEDGLKSCELGIEMYTDLVGILTNCSNALHQWSTKYQKRIGHSNEIGTTKKTWLETTRAVEKLAERNGDICKNIQKDVIDKLSSYKNENYGKSFIHAKKIKEFGKEFKKAQKPHLELLERIDQARDAYHESKRKLERAKHAAHVVESDVGSSDESKEKVKRSVEITQKQTDNCREKYKSVLKEMDEHKPKHQERMFRILAETDDFERKRLQHFKTMFTALKTGSSIEQDERHATMAAEFTDSIKKHDIEADIDFFNQHYGSKTTSKWPVFEEGN